MEFGSGELGNGDIGVEKKETILDGKQCGIGTSYIDLRYRSQIGKEFLVPIGKEFLVSLGKEKSVGFKLR